MSDKARYADFVARHPERFLNVPGGIEILLDPAQIAQAEATVAAQLAARGMPTAWAETGVAYQDQYLLILRDAVRFPDGSLGTYLRFTAPGDIVPGVVMLPIYEGQVVLERHYRHGPRAWLTEVPRGFGEAGYSPEENARRELLEEIGATVLRFESLGIVRADASLLEGYDHMFLVELSAIGAPDVGEGIAEIVLAPLAEFHAMVADGTITDAFTLGIYARACARGLL